MKSAEQRIEEALAIAGGFSQTDGGHHKAWVIDQMVRALTGDGYAAFIAKQAPPGYSWDEGIAP